MEEVIVSIPRLNCQGCVKNVKRAISGLAEVEVVSADPATKRVQLRYQPAQVSLETIKQTLASAKYPIAGEQVESQNNRRG